jgi:hypothetical protein
MCVIIIKQKYKLVWKLPNILDIILKIFSMDNLINNRLRTYIEYKKLNPNSFSKQLGYSNSEKISRLFRLSDAYPSYEIIFDISNKFEELNLNWLITGEGEMLKSHNKMEIKNKGANNGNNNNNTVINGHVVTSGPIEKITIGQKDVDMFVLEIESLKNENATLKKQIELQEKIIKMLEKG